MVLNVFQTIGQSVEGFANMFVTSASAGMIEFIRPYIIVGLTVYFLIHGYMIIGGFIQEPFFDFLKKCGKIALIAGIALTAGAYQSDVYNACNGFLDGMVGTIASASGATFVVNSGAGSGNALYAALDKAMGDGLEVGLNCFIGMSAWEIGEALAKLLCAVIIILGTVAITCVAAGFILLAKMALAVLFGIGPVFIALMMFPATVRFFDSWCGQVANYMLTIVILVAVMTMSLMIFCSAADKIKSVIGTTQLLGEAVQLAIFAFVCVIIIRQAPQIASALAGGVGLSSLHPMQALSSAAGMAMAPARVINRMMKAANPRSIRTDAQTGGRYAGTRVEQLRRGNTVFNPRWRQAAVNRFKTDTAGWGKSGGNIKKGS